MKRTATLQTNKSLRAEEFYLSPGERVGQTQKQRTDKAGTQTRAKACDAGVSKPCKTEKTKPAKSHRELFTFLVRVGIAAVLVAAAFLFFVSIRIVHNNDMYPFIREGQLVLVSKVSPVMGESAVLYRAPDGTEHFGRVMGLPGQKITVDAKEGVSVDGNVIYQTVPYSTPEGTISYPHTVEEDAYFIMNDYREQENDSRIYGSIPKEDVIGVVIFAVQYRGF